jgi:predicted ATPase
MITELRLQNFKNFKDATLRLGPFTVLVGANASGKSNIRDALRFLHGVGRGYSFADTIGGKYGMGGQLEWASLRGAANEIVRIGATGFRIDVNLRLNNLEAGHPSASIAKYHLSVEKSDHVTTEFRLSAEELAVDGNIVYSSHPEGDNDLGHLRHDATLLSIQLATTNPHGKGTIFRTQPFEPALASLTIIPYPEHSVRAWAMRVRDAFDGMRFLDLDPTQMRKPAFPGQTVLGDSGENLPAILQGICQAPERKAILIDWIQELTPMDIVDFEFPRDPSGLIHLLLKERSGITISAYSASDGTLRFLALLAALLGNHPAKLYVFEEIETGIHPSRLRLLLDLIERQTANNDIQVIATTHSSDLMQMISDSTFNNTSVVYRPRDTDHAIIRPVAELPDAPRLRAEQGLGPLHASGWMEDVLFFDGENEQAAAK